MSSEIVSLQPVTPLPGKIYDYETAERAKREAWVRKHVFLIPKYKVIRNPSDPRLYAPNKTVRSITDLTTIEEAKTLASLHIIEGGAGLAAPQIGLNKKMFTMTLPEQKYIVFFNPRIALQPGEEEDSNVTWGPEGCLSHPGISLDVARLHRVTFIAQTMSQPKPHKYMFEGLYARVVQHEICHLEGKLITDVPGHLRRNLIVHPDGQDRLFEENRKAAEFGFEQPSI